MMLNWDFGLIVFNQEESVNYFYYYQLSSEGGISYQKKIIPKKF